MHAKEVRFFWHWNNFSEIGPKEINKNVSTAVPLNVCVKKKRWDFTKISKMNSTQIFLENSKFLLPLAHQRNTKVRLKTD